MKKTCDKIIQFTFVSVISICSLLTACSGNTVTIENEYNKEGTVSSMFVEVERTGNFYVIYHKETKVMYAVSYGAHNCGTVTLLVDENGDPMLWEE